MASDRLIDVQRSFDLRLALTTESVNNQVHETHATAQAILNSSADASQAILRLEAVSMSISDEIGSMKSLLSAGSSRSQSDGERSLSVSAVWTKGWQCDQWQHSDDLFCPIEELNDGTQVRKCTFCGMPFLEPPALDIREHHLRITHKLGACTNRANLYLEMDLFDYHLLTVHNATLGPWTQTLVRACLVQNTPCEPAEELHSFAVDDVNSQGADSILGSAVEEWEEASPQSNTEALMTGLWDANLLGQWDSSRDRINRWMLHMLGAEAKHSDAHQAIYQEKYRGLLDVSSQMWSRLVLKYWFIDEAATGFEINALAEQLTLESNNSSLHLSARPSGTKSDTGVSEPTKLVHQNPFKSFYSKLRLQPALQTSNGARRGSNASVKSIASRVGSRASSMGSIAERLHSEPYDHPKASSTKIGTIGVCALDVQARSKPVRNLLNRLLYEDNRFDVVIFGDKVILDEDVLTWPMCDFLLSFTDREHFPLDKVIAYAKLRQPFCVNDIHMQTVLSDRRLYLRCLDSLGIRTPERVEVNRDDASANISPETAQRIYELTGMRQTGSVDGQAGTERVPTDIHLEDDGDTLVVGGKKLSKPFVEKPTNSKDHNILLYYRTSQGGGCRRLSRKTKHSTYSEDNSSTVPRCILELKASFIYEQFVGVNGTNDIKNEEDVTAYIAGRDGRRLQNLCYAEIRQSPMVNWVVERNANGREVTYETKLTKEEELIAAQIAAGFCQRVCEFDMLRSGDASYVIGVKGWSLPKNNNDFYEACAKILKGTFIREGPRKPVLCLEEIEVHPDIPLHNDVDAGSFLKQWLKVN